MNSYVSLNLSSAHGHHRANDTIRYDNPISDIYRIVVVTKRIVGISYWIFTIEEILGSNIDLILPVKDEES